MKAVGDALDGILRVGVTLNDALESSRQWARILGIGAIGPVTRDDFKSVVGADLGRFRVIVDGLHSRVTDFIRRVVVYRETAAATFGESGSWKTPWRIPTHGSDQTHGSSRSISAVPH